MTTIRREVLRGCDGDIDGGKGRGHRSVLHRGHRPLLQVLLALWWAAAVQGADWSAGRWLVDLGRDYGLASRSRPTNADATVILCFMQGAVRADPQIGEAYYWQVDLLPALGRPEVAVQALERYVACVPDDHAAHLMLIANKLEELQTAESRREYCEAYLKREGLGPVIVSDLHRRLAEFHHNRGETAEAQKEVEAALAAYGLNVAAKRLGYELSAANGSPTERVRVGLEMISANPSQVMLIWDLARLLDDLSLHDEAQKWYVYAAEIFSYANPGMELPTAFLLDWARSQLDGGNAAGAQATCEKAIAGDASSVDARLLMIEIAGALNRPEVAVNHREAVRKFYDEISAKVRERKDAVRAAGIAWFYAWYVPTPLMASAYGRIVAEAAGMDAFGRRAVGFADLLNERYESAIEYLRPLAREDQIAAIGLARALSGMGKTEAAAEVLRSAAGLRRSGMAFRLIEAELKKTGAEVPAAPDRKDVREILGRFDGRVLDFYRQPNKYLLLEMVTPVKEVEPCRSWEVTFRLKNIGPFPITLGQEMMITPKVMLSAVVIGDTDRYFHHYLRFAMNRRPVLLPNEFIEVTTTVDVGALRSAMFVTPQVTHEVTFSLLLDPVQTPKGGWAHRLGGFSVQPIRMRRKGLEAGAPQVAVLLSLAGDGSEAERGQAATLLAALVAEQDRLVSGVLKYRAEKIDETAVVQTLIDRLRDRSPLVRARTLEALRYVRGRGDLIKAMAPCLSDPDWMVRLMAMYSLAEMQGQVFGKVLERSAASDPDPLLRTFAGSYVQQWSAPATQPTATRPGP